MESRGVAKLAVDETNRIAEVELVYGTKLV